MRQRHRSDSKTKGDKMLIDLKQTKEKPLKDPAFKSKYKKAKAELKTEPALLESLKKARGKAK